MTDFSLPTIYQGQASLVSHSHMYVCRKMLAIVEPGFAHAQVMVADNANEQVAPANAYAAIDRATFSTALKCPDVYIHLQDCAWDT